MSTIDQLTATEAWDDSKSERALQVASQRIWRTPEGRFLRTTSDRVHGPRERDDWSGASAITASGDVPTAEDALTTALRILGRAGENAVDQAIDYLIEAPVSLRAILASGDGSKLWSGSDSSARYFKYAIIRAAGLRGESWQDHAIVQRCLWERDPVKIEAALLAVAAGKRMDLLGRVKFLIDDPSQPEWIRREAEQTLAEMNQA